jgi:hypothetical protein
MQLIPLELEHVVRGEPLDMGKGVTERLEHLGLRSRLWSSTDSLKSGAECRSVRAAAFDYGRKVFAAIEERWQGPLDASEEEVRRNRNFCANDAQQNHGASRRRGGSLHGEQQIQNIVHGERPIPVVHACPPRT